MPKLLHLEEEDVAALQRIARLTYESESAVMRHALRHYALAGAWRVGPRGIDPGEPLYPAYPDLGPDGREVG